MYMSLPQKVMTPVYEPYMRALLAGSLRLVRECVVAAGSASVAARRWVPLQVSSSPCVNLIWAV